MNPAVTIALQQLDDLLTLWDKVPLQHGEYGVWKTDTALFVRMRAAIARLAPSGSEYVRQAMETNELLELGDIARALRQDYESGYLSSIAERIHGELFGDFLEAAEHLLTEGFKDPAAVMAGGVLESHLRQLCNKHGLATTATKANGKIDSLSAESLNVELRNQGIYDLNTQKQVTALLAIRNSAAHAHYGDYDAARIKLYVAEVRNFVMTYPA